MSYAVVRGRPYEAQLYLDKILDQVIDSDRNKYNGVKDRELVTISELILHCMEQNPSATYMINGVTGEYFTNEQILRRCIRVARGLLWKGVSDKVVIVLMRNSEHMAVLYNAVMFAGVVPLMLEPSSTVYEIQHFIKLVDPYIVFCDKDRHSDVIAAVEHIKDNPPNVVIANESELFDQFVGEHSEDIESFRVTERLPKSSVMMLPTSGSTGLPKASILTHQGLVAQVPLIWYYYKNIPQPTKLVMLLSTPQWMTHTIMMTSSVVYNIPLLVTPRKSEPQHVVHLIETYQPTWSLFIPSLAPIVAAAANKNQMKSLETLILTGSPLSPDLKAIVEEKLSDHTFLGNGYGMTETHCFVTLQEPTTPKNSIGKIFNVLNYKIVDENEKEVGVNETGELYLKSEHLMFKGYHKNEEESRISTTSDGWFKTGDLVYGDEQQYIYYVARKKFIIKYFNHHISPEEVERLVAAVPGVQEAVVCGTTKGAAVAVLSRPGHTVHREHIHQAVSVLSEYKQLRGGIAFVDKLPRTYSGKVMRSECTRLLEDLTQKGLCF